MGSRREVFKKGSVTILGLGLAVISAAHALSSASLRNAPDAAVTLWPHNGRALEKVAYLSFVDNVTAAFRPPEGAKSESADGGPAQALNSAQFAATDELQRFAALEVNAMREAMRYDPLLPKAHAILALSQSDQAQKDRILALASKLNRRDLTLQALVLQSKANAKDYDGTIAVLDQILRVNPERGAEFFPVLTTALRQTATTTTFRDLLTRPLPWRDAFLMHAVQDPVAVRNLAVIRQSAAIGKPDFDRALVEKLVAIGDLATASRLYERFKGQRPATASSEWASDFPPFDWAFADEPGMRAQPSRDGQDLEFAVDPGRGGSLASRLMLRPQTPFTIQLKPRLEAGSTAKDLKLSLACAGEAQPFFEDTFADGRESFSIRQAPGCEYIVLTVSGRAWTGSAPLNGRLLRASVTPS